MSKLLKYEFKKSKNVTLAILLVTVIGEALFVTGTIAGAALAATFGIFIMAVLSIDILHRELNTNQSYMLFLTPKNSYQILGSKILANAISLSLLTVLFAVLAALDLLLIGIREVGMPVPADGIRRALGSAYLYMPTGVGKTIATAAAIAYGSWLFLIVTAYFAAARQKRRGLDQLPPLPCPGWRRRLPAEQTCPSRASCCRNGRALLCLCRFHRRLLLSRRMDHGSQTERLTYPLSALKIHENCPEQV